jgi:hypothetical protein
MFKQVSLQPGCGALARLPQKKERCLNALKYLTEGKLYFLPPKKINKQNVSVVDKYFFDV